MPWALLLVVAGLVVYFVTSYATLGLVLIGLGAGIFLFTLFLLLVGGLFVNSQRKKFNKEYNKFGGW